MFLLSVSVLMKEIFNGKALDVKYEHAFRKKQYRHKIKYSVL